MGNSPPQYRAALVRIRPFVESTYERLIKYKFEVDRSTNKADDQVQILESVGQTYGQIAKLLGNDDVQMPTSERDGLRSVKGQLFILQSAIEDYPTRGGRVWLARSQSLADISGAKDNHAFDPNTEPAIAEKHRNLSTCGFGNNKTPQTQPEPLKVSAQSQQVLLNQLQWTAENLRELMRWLDNKLERKWWLKELIRYLRVIILLATFISAALSVMYPIELVPIITLALTTSSGVLDIISQIFVKGQSPKSVTLGSLRGNNNNSTFP